MHLPHRRFIFPFPPDLPQGGLFLWGCYFINFRSPSPLHVQGSLDQYINTPNGELAETPSPLNMCGRSRVLEGRNHFSNFSPLRLATPPMLLPPSSTPASPGALVLVAWNSIPCESQVGTWICTMCAHTLTCAHVCSCAHTHTHTHIFSPYNKIQKSCE